MSMQWYIARRLMWAIFVTWVAMSVTWGLFTISPVGGELAAAQQAAMQGGDAEEAQEAYKKANRQTGSLWDRYIRYVVNMFLLNWGWSVAYEQPVMEVLANAWPYSMQYNLPASVLTVVLGMGLGLYSAMNKYTKTDYVATFIAFFGLSIPNFWFAIMLVLITGVWFSDGVLFGFSLEWFQIPTFYQTDMVKNAQGGLLGMNLIDPASGFEYGWIGLKNIRQILLPIIVVATAGFASQMRYSRAYTIEYANQEFVKTARAKGAGESRVLFKHIFRVALVPLSTVLVNDVLAFFITGSLIIEQIFQIPGLFLLQFRAITSNPDTAIVMATALIPIFVAVIGYLIQDLTYVALDPRIDYGDR